MYAAVCWFQCSGIFFHPSELLWLCLSYSRSFAVGRLLLCVMFPADLSLDIPGKFTVRQKPKDGDPVCKLTG